MYGPEIVKLFKGGGGLLRQNFFLGNYIYKYISNLMQFRVFSVF